MKKFRLTHAGLLYTLFSLSLLCAGFLCGELLTSICGAGLCLYCLQAILSLALSAAFLKNARYEAELKNNIITVKALFPGNARKKHPLVIPGIVSFYVFCFTTSGGEKNKNCKTLEIKIRLKKTINEFKIPEYKRGLYFLKSEYIELTDIAGFFSAAFFKDGKSVTEILIPPRIEEDCNFDLPSVFDETAGRLLNVRRTEELYESRPYIPGDDTRKINWKLYAHTEELAVLQGDHVQRPVVEALVVQGGGAVVRGDPVVVEQVGDIDHLVLARELAGEGGGVGVEELGELVRRGEGLVLLDVGGPVGGGDEGELEAGVLLGVLLGDRLHGGDDRPARGPRQQPRDLAGLDLARRVDGHGGRGRPALGATGGEQGGHEGPRRQGEELGTLELHGVLLGMVVGSVRWSRRRGGLRPGCARRGRSRSPPRRGRPGRRGRRRGRRRWWTGTRRRRRSTGGSPRAGSPPGGPGPRSGRRGARAR